MSDRLNDLLGVEREVTHKGKRYKLAPMGLEVMAKWECYLEDRAWAAMERRLARMPVMERAVRQPIMEQALLSEIAAGVYSTISMASSKAQTFPGGDGSRAMLKIRLDAANDGITDDLVDEILADKIEEIERMMRMMDAQDPNSPRPLAAGNGKASEPSSPASLNATSVSAISAN